MKNYYLKNINIAEFSFFKVVLIVKITILSRLHFIFITKIKTRTHNSTKDIFNKMYVLVNIINITKMIQCLS